jgi:endonuclease YncB( thermonuclease family)
MKETAVDAVKVLEYNKKRKNNMKKLTVSFVMSLLMCGFITNAIAKKQKEGVTYDAVFTRVIDGDTVAFQANFLPDPLKKELSIRVFGVDTPEKGHRAQCESENVRGQAASAFTKAQINASTKRQVVLMAWDKYGGRVLGDVLLDGKSLRQMLIQNGFAREYYGEAKKSWCN